MSWLSRLVLKLDADGREALRQAAFEENVRLALWRMDSTLSNIISLENARPYDSYPALLRSPQKEANPAAPPYATQTLVYFQFEPDGRLVLPEAADIQSAKLDQLRNKVTKSELLKSIRYTKDIQTLQKRRLAPEPDRATSSVKELRLKKGALAESEARDAAPERLSLQDSAAQLLPRTDKRVQLSLNTQELNIRNDILASNELRSRSFLVPEKEPPAPERTTRLDASQAGQTQQNPAVQRTVQSGDSAQAAPSSRDEWVPRSVRQNTDLELMHPVWLNRDLYLVRRVLIDGEEYVQGCWLDWPGIRRMLLDLVRDLLPAGNLVPLEQPPEAGQTRLLASIPVMLVPGPLPVEHPDGWSVLHASLGIAWLGVFLATTAIGIVLGRTIELNRRRGAFVSAVTHELRTPLTTFRMYTEMLNEGMVRDEEKRKNYIGTLYGEAERLGHLVDNVLAYSRLENRRGGAERVEAVPLTELKERLVPRLGERAGQSGMTLVPRIGKETVQASVRADLSAVERILFNLVDNAGKYARGSDNSNILFSIGLTNGTAVLSIRDHGPGIPQRLRKKLFLPFSKSADDAAGSAPGIGLGLAISRRLARQMRGDLVLDPAVSDGARFVLTLPLA